MVGEDTPEEVVTGVQAGMPQRPVLRRFLPLLRGGCLLAAGGGAEQFLTMAGGGWTFAALAEATGVDPKSVERWVNLGRVPRRATALKAAKALGEDVHALWPALRQARAARAVSPELVTLYDQRADLPVSVFVDLLAAARERIDVLVYAAVFLHEAYPPTE